MDKEDLKYDIYKYDSNIKKNEIFPFVTTWMDLKIIMLSKISQTLTNKNHMHSLIYVIWKKKN